MTSDYGDLYGIFPVDFDAITEYLKNTAANGVLSGLGASVTGSDLTVTIASGKARVGGVYRSFASTTNIDYTGDPQSNPRKSLIVINSAGTITKRLGAAAAPEPSDSSRRQTVTPDPPELSSGDLVLWEVWIGANATTITGTDLSDRRQDVFFNEPKTTVLTADSAKLPSVSAPTLATVNGTNVSYGVLDYADASTTSCFWSFVMPHNWFLNDLVFKIRWKATTATTGSVVWDVGLVGVAEGNAVDASPTAAGNTTGDSTAGSAANLNEFSLTIGSASIPASVTAGNLIHVRLQRLGGHANDTMTDTARFLHMTIEVR